MCSIRVREIDNRDEKNGAQFKNSAKKAEAQSMLNIKKMLRHWQWLLSHADVQSKTTATTTKQNRARKPRKGPSVSRAHGINLKDGTGKREAI